MAFKQVAIIDPQATESVVQRRREGWGKRGQAIGAVVGGIAGGVAGAGVFSVPGAIAGAAGGASLGGMVGERMRSSREEKTAIDRRVNTQAPQMVESDATEKLKQSIMALQSQPPEIRQEYMKPLVEAYALSAKQKQGGGNV